MRVPLGIATLEVGLLPASPVVTEHGTVHVQARGAHLRSRWGRAHWLQPHRARLHRPDGRIHQTPVPDGTGAVMRWLTATGLALAVGLTLIRNRWRSS